MSVTATPTRPGTRPWRLGARMRKAVLVVHIVSAAAWIGMDVVMGVLVFTALFADDDALVAVSYQALELFAVWPLLSAGLLCLASGVVLGLGTKYGVLRYWWVAVKLAINVIFSVLIVFALRPGVADAAEQGRLLAAGVTVRISATDLAFPPIVSTTGLIVAVLLSVFKPWGWTRRRAELVARRPSADRPGRLAGSR